MALSYKDYENRVLHLELRCELPWKEGSFPSRILVGLWAQLSADHSVRTSICRSMDDRYNILDVEALTARNHELTEEVMRLHQENFELSRQVLVWIIQLLSAKGRYRV